MISWPDKFDDATRPLPTGNLGQAGAEAARKLAERGYEVHAGLTSELAAQVLTMSTEPSIREFCPKDLSERFIDRAATERWLAKKRAAFLLFRREDSGSLGLAGYGWSGAGSNHYAPKGDTTFAVRIGEAGQGHGLAAPFSWLIIAASTYLYGAQDFWLETWASNGGAVHIYHKIGFVTVAEQSSERLVPDGKTITDTRIYMSLPNELLPPQVV
jgi:hypothetical protein